MLVTALACSLVSFLALVAYVVGGQEWTLWLVFVLAAVAAVLVVVDAVRKARADKEHSERTVVLREGL